MIVFGIDPGSRRTGWGVIQMNGTSLRCLEAGVISVSEDAPLFERLEPIFQELSEKLRIHRPEFVALESIFHHRNAKSALVLGHARGVALLAARLYGCPIGEIAPTEVKKAVTGSGRAEKDQVQRMVRAILSLEQALALDASDALAVAIAGSAMFKSKLRMQS